MFSRSMCLTNQTARLCEGCDKSLLARGINKIFDGENSGVVNPEILSVPIIMAVQPTRQLSLDGPHEGFVSFLGTLPEKPSTTIRFFDRGDYYTVHGEDAMLAAKEIFKTTSVVKTLGSGQNTTQGLSLSRNNFEAFIRELLLVKQYRIEVYQNQSSAPKTNDWILASKASPGNVIEFEELLFGSMEQTASTGILGIKLSTENDQRIIGAAFVEPLQKQFQIIQFTDSDTFSNLEALLVQLGPKEAIIQADEASKLRPVAERHHLLVTERKKTDFAVKDIVQDLNRLIRFRKGQSKDAAVLPEMVHSVAMSALAAVIKYLELMSTEDNFHKYYISSFDLSLYMRLDGSAVQALHLLPMAETQPISIKLGSAPQTLFALLNKCRTAAGQRLLGQWIKQPLLDKAKIEERLDLVEIFVEDSQLRQTLSEDYLKRIPDMQRLGKKFLQKNAGLQDCYKVYLAILKLPLLVEALELYVGNHGSVLKAMISDPLKSAVQDFEKFREMVESTMDLTLVEQGEYLVKADFDDDLLELRQRMQELEEQMKKSLQKVALDLDLEAQKTIKLESSNQFGYFFRVTLKDEKAIRNNKNYSIIDSTKAGARFRNSVLTELNDEYLEVHKNYEEQQKTVVDEIMVIAGGYSDPLRALNDTLARLDVLVALATAAVNAPLPYVRPRLLEKGAGKTVIKELRHPCLELQENLSFIPNDVEFDKNGASFHIITGPNMGGKSTYLRSVGLAVLMAQMGSFVPCSEATVTLVDAILARVGAGDCQIKGVSTFMAEMLDTSYILRSGTSDSLILIDELGRGTSTYDGFGLAWAISEHIARKIESYALFATHFHELTALANVVPSVSNSHVTALTSNESLTLLYRVRPGICDQSFGLHVAELVQFPEKVLEEARQKAAELEDFQAGGLLSWLTGSQENGNEDGPASKKAKMDSQEDEAQASELLKEAKNLVQNAPSEEELIKGLERLQAACKDLPSLQSLLAH